MSSSKKSFFSGLGDQDLHDLLADPVLLGDVGDHLVLYQHLVHDVNLVT